MDWVLIAWKNLELMSVVINKIRYYLIKINLLPGHSAICSHRYWERSYVIEVGEMSEIRILLVN